VYKKIKQKDGTYKIQKVMEEFKSGTLRSSSGGKVKNRRQAIAIALSEQKRYNQGKY
jgi:hypothetical protein